MDRARSMGRAGRRVEGEGRGGGEGSTCSSSSSSSPSAGCPRVHESEASDGRWVGRRAGPSSACRARGRGDAVAGSRLPALPAHPAQPPSLHHARPTHGPRTAHERPGPGPRAAVKLQHQPTPATASGAAAVTATATATAGRRRPRRPNVRARNLGCAPRVAVVAVVAGLPSSLSCPPNLANHRDHAAARDRIITATCSTPTRPKTLRARRRPRRA